MEEKIKIIIGGDICPGGMFYYKGGPSSELCDYLAGFDYRVATLESAMGEGYCFCTQKMNSLTGGNIIYSPDECIRILKSLKIDAVSLANNHSCDNGISGLIHTFSLLESNGIAYFGAGRNAYEASRPHVVTVRGKRLCFLGYYPPQMRAPYPPSATTGGMNQLIEGIVLEEIRQFKEKYDYVFVIPHWGTEHTMFPNMNSLSLAYRFIDAGADFVLGSHTHTIQPVLRHGVGFIAMSMGNFCFPDRFIDAPRVSAYPTDGLALVDKVPHTEDYPMVSTLTYKHVRRKERFSLMCEIELCNKNLLSRKYTYLSEEHELQKKELPLFHRLQLSLLEWVLMGPAPIYRGVQFVHNIMLRIQRRWKRIRILCKKD